MKPLIEQYSITEASGKKYALKQSPETELKANLENYKARQLFELMKEQQAERFQQMVTDNSIVPFLNRITESYYKTIRQLMDKGMNEAEAAETEWPKLMVKAGLR